MAVVSGTGQRRSRCCRRWRASISTATTSIDAVSSGSWRPGREQHDERQRGADVGKDQRVDGRRDVRPADVHRPLRQHDAASSDGLGLVELGDGGRLGHRHVVEDAQGAEDDAGQEQPADVDVGAGRPPGGKSGVLRAAELREPGRARRTRPRRAATSARATERPDAPRRRVVRSDALRSTGRSRCVTPVAATIATHTGSQPARISGTTILMMTASVSASAISERTPRQPTDDVTAATANMREQERRATGIARYRSRDRDERRRRARCETLTTTSSPTW